MAKKRGVRALKNQILDAQQSAAEKEVFLRAILRTLPDMIWLKNAEGVYLACNPMFEKFFGAKESDIVGKTDYDFIDRAEADFFREHDRKAMAAGKPSMNEEKIVFADDGRHAVLETIKTPMVDEDGSLVGVLGISRDITERKRMEEALCESQRSFANAFSYAPIGMALVSPAGDCLKVNLSLCRLLGYEPDELTTMNIVDLIHPEDYGDTEEHRRRLISGENDSFQVERRYLGKAGQMAWTLVSASMVRSEEGKPLYFIAQIEDISDRKRLEQELRVHAAKLEEMVERRTQELLAANQELTAMNEEVVAVNARLEESNQQLTEEIAIRLEKEAELLLRESQYRAASTLLISSSAKAEDQMREAVQDALALVAAPIGYIGLYDERARAFDIRCAIGPEAALLQGFRPDDRGMLGEVFRSGEILYVPDYRRYPQRQADAPLARLSSSIMIPLKKGDQVKGVLVVAWLDETYAVRMEEIEVLSQYANLVSIALERNDTQMRIERKNRLLQGLAETTAALMGELELDAVLQEMLAKAMNLAEISHGFVLLLDEDDPHEVCFRAGHGRYRDKIGQRETWRGGVFEEMLRLGRMVVVEDYARWPLRDREAEQNGVTMSTQSPLKVDGKIIGAIGLTACGEIVAMDPEKIAVLEQFTHVASIAVKNALYHEKIRKLAYRDTLTGLPNRTGLSSYLERELEQARKGEAAGAVMFIDLDDLKTVNDHFGHTSGDSVIVSAGTDIVAAAGKEAFVARVGGDEFVVILPGVDTPERVGQIADRLVGAIRREYEVRGQQIHMSTSLGATLYPADGDVAEEILKNADIAMYAAKAAGKNCWRLYEQGMHKDTYEKMMLTGSLRHALENGELYMHYQPLISLKNQAVDGFEALLRWNGREYGAVAPARFIPLAEQSGLILPIGEWVFGEACRFARILAESGRAQVRVAVNVSPRQLAAEDFVGMVRRSIETAGIRPQQLEVEITENVLIESLKDSNRKLAELSALGVQLALDDFGTGFSSLTYLRNLPVKTLKIDKSFIDRILEDRVQEGFIRSIIDMAHVLSLQVVAEGVETGPQLAKLSQLGCDGAQGYVFSRPVSQADAIRFSLG